jgi:hypothetical protein
MNLDFQFVSIPLSIVLDKKLSPQSLGIIAYILSKPTNWVIDKENILDQFSNPLLNTRLTARQLDICLNEIEESGYMQ